MILPCLFHTNSSYHKYFTLKHQHIFSLFSSTSTLLFHTKYLTLNKHSLAGAAGSDNLAASREMKVKDIPLTVFSNTVPKQIKCTTFLNENFTKGNNNFVYDTSTSCHRWESLELLHPFSCYETFSSGTFNAL